MPRSLSGFLPPNSGITGYATEGALLISSHLSIDAVAVGREIENSDLYYTRREKEIKNLELYYTRREKERERRKKRERESFLLLPFEHNTIQLHCQVSIH